MLRVGRFAVVAVWIGLLLVLARSQWPPADPGSASPSAPSGVVAADETWMGVYMRGQKIGYSYSRITPADGGYRCEETSYLRLTMLEQVQTVRLSVDATTTSDFALRAFSVALDSGLGVFDVRGTVEPNALVLRTTAGGETSEQRIALTAPLYLPSSARAHLRGAQLVAGQSFTMRVFDPSSMEHQPLQLQIIGRAPITVAGQASEAWHVRETFRGMQTSVWLDDAGRTLREEGPLDMVAEREDAVRAFSGGWGDDAFDLMAAVAVRVRPPIRAPRHLARLDARLSGLGDLVVPTDRRQSLRDGILHVERESADAATFELPYAGREWRHELQATPFMQVDHPRMRAAATQILAGERDARRAAERLRTWVYDEVEKRPLASLPSALAVLETRAGDCNEHAVLFAALARAAGLPARVVAGIVYSDDAFLYHAWNEVWTGADWLSVDPAFDQMPADATHVKLITGGPEMHAALMPVIGKLSLDLLPTATGSNAP
jgi:hypothetical protein